MALSCISYVMLFLYVFVLGSGGVFGGYIVSFLAWERYEFGYFRSQGETKKNVSASTHETEQLLFDMLP